jgi:3-dehydroquinate synthase
LNTIQISVSTTYEVKVGQGLLCQLGDEVASVLSGRQAVIVSDSNVYPLYGNTVRISLERAGFTVYNFNILAGENSKTIDNYFSLLTFLSNSSITRSDCLIALGGGVVGDLTGFAAATYLRGIPYIQVPTSLLAMVDSSVGGKTAINLPAGKNLAGAFYQPALVLCDTDTLQSLPQRQLQSGCAEVIKYGILYDPALFLHLEQESLNFHRESVISRCIELKKVAVMEDEFDIGSRRMLNLGHSIGHSIEILSDYAINHGEAVSIGMSIMARCASANMQCSATDRDRIIEILDRFGLPTSPQFSPAEISNQMLADKKRNGDHITLVVPATIGCAKLLKLPIIMLENYVKKGM